MKTRGWESRRVSAALSVLQEAQNTLRRVEWTSHGLWCSLAVAGTLQWGLREWMCTSCDGRQLFSYTCAWVPQVVCCGGRRCVFGGWLLTLAGAALGRAAIAAAVFGVLRVCALAGAAGATVAVSPSLLSVV